MHNMFLQRRSAMFLYHYFDSSIGPFLNLSDLSADEAKSVLETIKTAKPNSRSAKRHDKYVEYRRNCENIIRTKYWLSLRSTDCPRIGTMTGNTVPSGISKLRYGVMKQSANIGSNGWRRREC